MEDKNVMNVMLGGQFPKELPESNLGNKYLTCSIGVCGFKTIPAFFPQFLIT